MGNPKPWRNPRNMLLHLILCALAIVFLLLLDDNA